MSLGDILPSSFFMRIFKVIQKFVGVNILIIGIVDIDLYNQFKVLTIVH